MPTGAFEVSRVRAALADRYRIDHVLGEGGMATVYLAEDLKHHRKVAVKVMRPELAETLGAERFLREVEIAAKLSHPHILPVYDSGASQGILYYVMPLVEGESLPARIAREKQLPVDEALRIAREVAGALAYAHKQGFVHRDIKPANILISDGHALVADFGIARAMAGEGKAITKTGLAIGTPQYMSPEQASGAADVDGRTDLYSLGAVIYEMLAGEPPFTGPTAQAIITRSITEQPRPLEQTRQTLPAEVGRTVLRALAKAPADRYATAGDMVAALADAEDAWRTGGRTAATGMPSRPAFGWKRMAIMAVVVLAFGALLAKLFLGPRGSVTSGGIKSVAVLPFENQGSADDAYFADGIVDEVRGRLAKLGQFKVIASASANQYRETTKTGPEIAAELKVDQVLMGKVRWASGPGGQRRVQVVAELVDGKTGSTTWQDTFDADVTDVFAIQSQIAAKVAGALGGVLRSDAREDLADRPTQNSEAYDLYLKGRAVTSNAASAQRQAGGYLAQAVALDSTFAQAWAQLAVALSLVYVNGTREQAVGERAREAAERALRLAPDEGFAYYADAMYQMNVAADLAARDRAVNRGLEVDPENAVLLSMSADQDLREERYAEMRRKLTKARELDPRSIRVLTNLIRASVYLGRLDEALAASEEMLALQPDDPGAIEWMAIPHLVEGDLPGARAVIRQAMQHVSVPDMVTYFAGYNELAFALEPQDRELLYRLTPAAFDNDRAWWSQALSIAAHQQGDERRARAYADSGLAESRAQSAMNPDDSQLRALYAVMLAYAGHGTDAIREVERAMEQARPNRGQDNVYSKMQGVRVYIATGQAQKALDLLGVVMNQQYFVTPGYLKVDPTFDPLRNDPRFQKLVAQPIKTASGD